MVQDSFSRRDRALFRSRRPGPEWRVDMMVTWLALHAYHGYHVTFEDFKHGPGYSSDGAKRSIRGMAVKATAVSMLALVKAHLDLQ